MILIRQRTPSLDSSPRPRVCAERRGQVEGEEQLYLAPDDEPQRTERARPRDLPRLDKPGHPHHGRPYLPVVISGMGMSTVDERGQVVPLDPVPDDPDPGPKPERKPREAG